MKKITMTIRQRDKRMLVFLLAWVALYLLYHFLASPALEQRGILIQERSAYREEMFQVTTLIKQHSTIKQEARSQERLLTEKYSMFLPEVNQERLLHRLDVLINNSGLEVKTYTMTKTVSAPLMLGQTSPPPMEYPLLEVARRLNPKLVQPSGLGGELVSVELLATSDIILSFQNSSYDGLLRFLDAVNRLEKSMLVKSISLSRSHGNVGGQIILSLYALPKPNDTDADFLKFEPVLPRGKTNPLS